MWDKVNIEAIDLGSLPDVSKEHLGKLIIAFGKKFPTYSIFPMFYMSNANRGQFRLYVSHGLTDQMKPDNHFECYNAKIEKILAFVYGFIYACDPTVI